jgi:3D (Asp-Asp-Asp) domain-containing protein
LPSCSTTNWVENGESLKSDVHYEVRKALPLTATYIPRQVPNYYFKLDAPAHESPSTLMLKSKDGKGLCVRTTAYCHAEQDHIKYGHLAASGGQLKFGKVCSAAADWSRYPLGTRFKIASQPNVIYEVDDYGSALVGSGTIDLYRPTFGTMNAWGVREVNIEILQWGSYSDSLKLMRGRIHFPHVRRMVQDIEQRTAYTTASTDIKATPLTAMAAPMMASLLGLSPSLR